jgi:hypothetical protein
MAEITLTEMFGPGTTQDATTVTFLKADLVASGLVATANNKAEAILYALIRKAAVILTPTNLDQNADQSIVIGTPTISTDDRLSKTYLVNNITVGVQRLIADGAIAPGDL